MIKFLGLQEKKKISKRWKSHQNLAEISLKKVEFTSLAFSRRSTSSLGSTTEPRIVRGISLTNGLREDFGLAIRGSFGVNSSERDELLLLGKDELPIESCERLSDAAGLVALVSDFNSLGSCVCSCRSVGGKVAFIVSFDNLGSRGFVYALSGGNVTFVGSSVNIGSRGGSYHTTGGAILLIFGTAGKAIPKGLQFVESTENTECSATIGRSLSFVDENRLVDN